MKNAGLFYRHLEYITAILYILRSFGNLLVIWHMFSPFWYIVRRKIWQPWSSLTEKQTKLLLSECQRLAAS
jgi:hypothetical protein